MSIDRTCKRENCEKPVPVPQAHYCSDACRMRAYRARQKKLKGIVARAVAKMQPGAPTGRLFNANDLVETFGAAPDKEMDELFKWFKKSR